MAPQIDADCLSHGDDIHADAVHNLRLVPSHHSDNFPAVTLHLLRFRNGGVRAQ
jgi:hypothetical protein